MSVMFQIAVAGAHLSGLALNHQLLDLGARLVRTVRTAPVYRMYSLGPKPALIREPQGSKSGKAIELEVWEMPIEKVGFFLRDGVTPPLGIGDVLLEDGSEVKGFIGETYAVKGAPDITKYGGWRAYLASQSPSKGKGKGGSDGRSSGAASPVPNGTVSPVPDGTAAAAPQAAAGSSIGSSKGMQQTAAAVAGVAMFMCAVMA